MFLFYVGIGYLSSIAVDVLISTAAPDYEEPEINPSLLMLLNAGPSEESLAFGIPYYASGNVYIVLVTGIIWASVHLFNTQFLDVGHLAYGNLVFALCYLFFSLRTWASGMGWFSIIAHSTFDGIAFLQSCISGKPCTINESSDFFMIALSFILLFVTYYLYAQRKFKDENKKMQARPALVGSPIFPLSDVACRNCGSHNPDYASNCYKCENILSRVCSTCSGRNSIDSVNCIYCGNHMTNRVNILSRLVRPSKRRAGLVIMISLLSLFVFPVYVSYPVIMGTMTIAITRKPRQKQH
jgi:ribosomal protein L40E